MEMITKRRWPLFSLIVCLLLIGGVLLGIVIFRHANQDVITGDKYDRVRTGMRATEVLVVLGRDPDSKTSLEPINRQNDPNGGEVWCWAAQRHFHDEDPDVMIRELVIVQFDARGVVTAKSLTPTLEEPGWYDRFRALLRW